MLANSAFPVARYRVPIVHNPHHQGPDSDNLTLPPISPPPVKKRKSGVYEYSQSNSSWLLLLLDSSIHTYIADWHKKTMRYVTILATYYVSRGTVDPIRFAGNRHKLEYLLPLKPSRRPMLGDYQGVRRARWCDAFWQAVKTWRCRCL